MKADTQTAAPDSHPAIQAAARQPARKRQTRQTDGHTDPCFGQGNCTRMDRRRHTVAALSGAGVLASAFRAMGSEAPVRPTHVSHAPPTPPLRQAVQAIRGGTQTEHRMACSACQTGSLGFLLYLPSDYETSEGPWPVIYHLHGGGECEGQTGFGPLTKDGVNLLSAVKAHGIPAIAEDNSLPCVVVSPQCPYQEGGRTRGWGTPTSIAALEQLADMISDSLNVDTNRQYLTGLSMGGYGTWEWAFASPGRFAALAPVCGGWRDDATRAQACSRIAHVPHYIAHGANDKIVPVERSDTMVQALRNAGATEVVYCRYTASPAPFQPTDWSESRADGSEGAPLAPQDLTGHDSWTQTYTDPNFFKWLLAKRREMKAL